MFQVLGTTTEPIRAGSFEQPEFIRPKNLNAIAGIKRSHAFELIRDGTLRSVLLRQDGSRRGIRLIHWPSVKATFHKLMDDQQAPIRRESNRSKKCSYKRKLKNPVAKPTKATTGN
jgi:hypothetical protein